ncbi:MAG TPA: thioredoxin domain-containing protein, partial [Polyangiaceae bacterium]|nr:thioredoxin domain-containing protein [Polyangiaceae bacterium]
MLAPRLRMVDLTCMTAHKANRLAKETSPYLLSHAMNPVDWFAWGEEALAKAKAEDKPIFLSIGYAACHWCHVMEKESFEDEGVAKLLNDGFVAIKVDREERPDLDSVYMTATVAMSGSGGWPMSVFLTPSGAPFFAGTYFPKSSKYGRPGFTTILERIRELWTTDRKQLLEQAKELVRALEDEAAATAPRPIDAGVTELAVKQLGRGFDPRWGGFGGAPKFPAPFSLELLLRHHARTGDAEARRMVTVTLDKMAEGGMFDHVGGGFARYSTDERWLVPHFEKMLYDNAQLARVYTLAWQALGETRWRTVATRTLDYVVREMQGAHGGYFSATDADSEGVEGKFFVWSLAEIEALLGEADARAFAAAHDVTEEGNWEGHNVLWTPRPLDDVARELGLTRAALDETLERGRAVLYEARKKRVPPLLDDKVLAAWNGLMIGAMAVASRAFDEPRYRESAERAAAAILGTLRRPDGGLFRTFREGRAHVEAVLEDYAFLADGLVDLFEATGEPRWLKEALALAERAALDFAGAPEQGFYSTSKDAEKLVVRMREGQDGATPSANAVLSRALVRLSHHADRADLREVAEAAIRAHGRAIGRAPRAFTTSIDVVERLVAPAVEIAVVGADLAGAEVLEAELARSYLPHGTIARTAATDGTSTHPLLRGKTPKGAQATAFVCRDFVCNAPVTTAADLRRDLDEAMARWRGEAKSGIAPKAAAGTATAAATRTFVEAHAPAAGASPALVGALGDAIVNRAGVLIASHTEGDAKSLVVQSVRAGRNVIAFDLGRAALVGDALAELAASGGPGRDALVLVGVLHEADAAHTPKLAAGARATSLDLVLVPWAAPPGARDDAAAEAATSVAATSVAARVGLYLERPLTTEDVAVLARVDGVTAIAAPFNLLEGDPAAPRDAKARRLDFVALRPLDAMSNGRVLPLWD